MKIILSLVAFLLSAFTFHAFAQEIEDSCRPFEINLHLEKAKIGKYWTNGHIEFDEPKLNFFKIKIGTGFEGEFGQYAYFHKSSLQGGHMRIADGHLIVNGIVTNDAVDNYGGMFLSNVSTVILTDIKNGGNWEIKPSIQNHIGKNTLGFLKHDEFAIAPISPGIFLVSKKTGDEVGIHFGPNFMTNSGFELQEIGTELRLTVHSDLCPLPEEEPKSFEEIAAENLAE
jgi:hypothetical protein